MSEILPPSMQKARTSIYIENDVRSLLDAASYKLYGKIAIRKRGELINFILRMFIPLFLEGREPPLAAESLEVQGSSDSVIPQEIKALIEEAGAEGLKNLKLAVESRSIMQSTEAKEALTRQELEFKEYKLLKEKGLIGPRDIYEHVYYGYCRQLSQELARVPFDIHIEAMNKIKEGNSQEALELFQDIAEAVIHRSKQSMKEEVKKFFDKD